MSEKIDQFVEKLTAHLKSVEQKLVQAREGVADESKEAAAARHRRIEEVKSRIDQIRKDAVARTDEIREKISNCETDTKVNVEEHVQQWRRELKDQFNDLQQSWGDVLTDVSGGTLF